MPTRSHPQSSRPALKPFHPVASGENDTDFLRECEHMTLPVDQKIDLFERLASMLKSGGTKTSEIDFFRAETESFDALKQVGSSRLAYLIGGKPQGEKFVRAMNRLLSEWNQNLVTAAPRFPKIFDAQFQALLAAGYEAGKLPAVIGDHVKTIKKRKINQDKIKIALLIPAITIATGLLVAAFAFVKIIPAFSELYLGLIGQEQMEGSTLILFTISQFLSANWMVLVPGVALSVFAYGIGRQMNQRIRYGEDWLVLRLPMIGNLVAQVNAYNFLYAFVTLTESGNDRPLTFKISCEAIDHLELRLAAIRAQDAYLSNHTSIHQNLALAHPVFSEASSFYRQLESFENQTGLTDDLVSFLNLLEHNIDLTRERIAQLLSPISLLVCGGMVLFIATAIYLPVFQLIGKMAR